MSNKKVLVKNIINLLRDGYGYSKNQIKVYFDSLGVVDEGLEELLKTELEEIRAELGVSEEPKVS